MQRPGGIKQPSLGRREGDWQIFGKRRGGRGEHSGRKRTRSGGGGLPPGLVQPGAGNRTLQAGAVGEEGPY